MIPTDTEKFKRIFVKLFSELSRLKQKHLKKLPFKINKPNVLFLNQEIPASIRKFFSPGRNRTAVYGSLVVLILSLVIFSNTVNAAYSVEINDKEVALVKNKEEVDNLLKEVIEETSKEFGAPVNTKDKITFKRTKAKKIDLDGSLALKRKLNRSLQFYSQGVAVQVNGQNCVVVKNKDAAQEVLDTLSKGDKETTAQVKSVQFIEQVELAENVESPINKIIAVDEAVEYIKSGGQEEITYIVKEGDSLWSIARAHDMRVKELQAANPQLRGEKLDIGQSLKLVGVQPLINVQTTLQVASTQKIPFKVEYKKDTSIKNGKEKISQKGSEGLRERTYEVVLRNGIEQERKLLNEKVIKNAVTQVVLRGNKPVILASRSDGGEGNLAWPASGGLTSGYGTRWGRPHTGIDIDGGTGDPIRAAEGGLVTFTGWYYEYGNMISIDHGNGLVTRYGHLSKISVSTGDVVSRGEVIGKMGSTGRSTGSHLHFETMVNDRFQNPMKFLR